MPRAVTWDVERVVDIWWKCIRWPWGCSKKHATMEDAIRCSNREDKDFSGKSEGTAYWKDGNNA